MSDSSRFWVVVPAAGSGRRFGAEVPKQYLPLGPRTVLETTLASLLAHPRIAGLQLVLAADDHCWPRRAMSMDPRIRVCVGGAQRMDSVLAGLTALQEVVAEDDWVWVHDAARPLLPISAMDRLMSALDDDATAAALLALPVRDTVKQADAAGRAAITVPREPLWLAQTPQVFRLGQLMAALNAAVAAGSIVTDEAQALERQGIAARLVEGDPCNLKITTATDLALVESYLKRASG